MDRSRRLGCAASYGRGPMADGEGSAASVFLVRLLAAEALISQDALEASVADTGRVAFRRVTVGTISQGSDFGGHQTQKWWKLWHVTQPKIRLSPTSRVSQSRRRCVVINR